MHYRLIYTKGLKAKNVQISPKSYFSDCQGAYCRYVEAAVCIFETRFKFYAYDLRVYSPDYLFHYPLLEY